MVERLRLGALRGPIESSERHAELPTLRLRGSKFDAADPVTYGVEIVPSCSSPLSGRFPQRLHLTLPTSGIMLPLDTPDAIRPFQDLPVPLATSHEASSLQ